MSITTRKIMEKLWHTDELSAQEEADSMNKSPDEFLTDINYEQFNSPEEEEEVISALKQSLVPDHLDSVSGLEHIKPRLLALAASHFNDYEAALDEGEPDLIDLYIAYKGGYYDALTFEITKSLNIITTQETSDDVRKYELAQLFKHLERMSQLYWTVGFAYASRTMINVARFYANNPETSAEANHHYELAAKYFFFGKQLMQQQQSKDICERLYPEEGYAGTGWGSMDSAESEVLSHVPAERRIGLFTQSQAELCEMIGSNISLRSLRNQLLRGSE